MVKSVYVLVLIGCLCFGMIIAFAPVGSAQEENRDALQGPLALIDQGENALKQETAAPTFSSAEADYYTLRENHRFKLLIGLMIVTIIVVGMIGFFFTRNDYTAEQLLSAIGLVLVIQATSFVVVAALTSEQLTTAIGVLGAIAGYLFGTAARRERSPQQGQPASPVVKSEE